jgi:hypothetical protein
VTIKWKVKIVRVLKSSLTCIKSTGKCSTYWGEEKCVHEGRKLLGRSSKAVRIILKQIIKKRDGEWTGFLCLRIGRE